jgi:hypothetical protein
MSESGNLEEVVDHITEPSAWIRVIFMIAFSVVLYFILVPIVIVLMGVQAVFSIVSGDANRNLKFLGASLTKYITQIVEFITYNSELKPFPFSDFPDVDDSDEASVADSGSGKPSGNASSKAKAKKPAVKKPAVKKAVKKSKPTTKKKVVKKKATSAGKKTKTTGD